MHHPYTYSSIQGWDGVAMSAAKEWLQDITRTQLHKFLTGMAPIKRVANVVSAVSALMYGGGGGANGSPRRGAGGRHHHGYSGGSVAVAAQVAETMHRTVSAAVRSQLLAQVSLYFIHVG